MSASNFLRLLGVGAATLILGTSCADRPRPGGQTEGVAEAVTAPRGASLPLAINTFVVYAAHSVTLGTDDRVFDGDIGVATSDGPSPALSVGDFAKLDRTRTLFAPSISVGGHAAVGSVDTNSLSNNGGHIGVLSAYPALMPALPAVFTATAGTQSVTVAHGDKATLNPGNFGVLTDNGKIFLNPGVYSFSSVTLGPDAELVARPGGSTSVRIAGTLATGTFAKVLPLDQHANALTITVLGSDGTNGSSPAASIGANTLFTSLLVAPNGTLSLGDNTKATGAFIAANVVAGTRVQLRFQSGFASAVPVISGFVAYAEQSLTLGTGDHTFGGDIGVAAIAAPSFGAQLIVGDRDLLDPQHELFAPSVSLGALAVVGDIEANTLTEGRAISGTQEPYPTSAMPLLPLASAGTPGTTNVTVMQHQRQTLAPGSFGALTDNGVVYLKPGTYSFSSIALGKKARLVALEGGPTNVLVADVFSTGAFAEVSPDDQPASALSISVSGNDGSNGSPAVSLGTSTEIVCVLNAPRGTVSFGNDVNAKGAFAGFSITAGKDVTLIYQSGFPPQAQQPVGQQQLNGYITPNIAAAPLVGPVPQSTPITMAISLPVRVPTDFPSLADFAREVSDPTNARYRQFLTPDNYASHYRPSQTSYDTLTSFAQQGGLSILNSYDDNELVDIKGTAAQFDRLLFANLNFYLRPDGSQFFALDREPSLDLSIPVLHVGGTDNFIVHQHGAIPSGSNGLVGNDFRNAYVSGCASGLDGSGQSIALIEEEGFNVSDVQTYDAVAGIPDPSIITDTFSANFPASLFAPDIAVNGKTEAPLDVEVAHAMAPGAQIVVYQSPEASAFGVNFEEDMLHAAAHPSGIVPRSLQVSSSWFISADSDSQQSINAMSSMGQSFFQASGDGGAYTSTPLDIRTFDNVTVVGGTILVSAAPGSAPSETAWAQTGSSSGGGFLGPSAFPLLGNIGVVGIPSYQTAFVNASNLASSTFRNVPDVSMVATGIFGVTTGSDGTKGVQGGGFNGTSFATPMFAGFMAMTNQKSQANGVGPVGFANPVLYAIANSSSSLYAATFNDVQSGSNPVNVNDHGFVLSAPSSPPPTGGFPAVTGFDLATGLGSPTCGLLTQLASPTPTVPVTSVPPTITASSSFAGLAGGESCGIVQGALECWGDNGHTSPVCSPLATSGTAVSSVTVGAAVCVILQADNSVSCFGDNKLGELGPQAIGQTSSATPVPITGFPAGTSVVQISGGSTICALLSDGSVWCWGANSEGQLGNGTVGSSTDANPNPTQVQGLPAAAQVSVGGGYVCAVLQSGNVSCWGSNLDGIMGVHSLTPTPTPQTIKVLGTPLANVTSISAGGDHACALASQVLNEPTSGVALYCWGDDHFNQLGVGDINNGALDNFELFPRLAGEITGCQGQEPSLPGGGGCPTPLPVVGVACGGRFTCVLLTDGTVRCVGDNTDGELGNGLTSIVPEATPQTAVGLSDITAISVGGGRTCAQHSTGAISCWGAAVVGNGTTGNVKTPAALDFARCM